MIPSIPKVLGLIAIIWVVWTAFRIYETRQATIRTQKNKQSKDGPNAGVDPNKLHKSDGLNQEACTEEAQWHSISTVSKKSTATVSVPCLLGADTKDVAVYFLETVNRVFFYFKKTK